VPLGLWLGDRRNYHRLMQRESTEPDKTQSSRDESFNDIGEISWHGKKELGC